MIIEIPLENEMPNLTVTKHASITLFILLVVTVLGLVRLVETFAGDQAMFIVYAKEINSGALLYRDVWDLKQPGIFLFYLTGGKLFGFTEFGIHLFELFYWLTFSVTLSITLRDYFRRSVFAALSPLLTVGVYYVICGSWHLTQVEGLVGFPLYLTLFAAIKAARAQSVFKNVSLLFFSGLAGGIVLFFKLILLPIVLLFWLSVLIFLIMCRVDASLPKVLFRTAAPILSGLAIPILATVVYFAWHDTSALINYTFFEYPAQAVTAFSDINRTSELKRGLRWFVVVFLPLIILILAWVLIAVKNLKASNGSLSSKLTGSIRRMDLLTVNLILWLCAGFGAILLQRLSWWEYHYLLLLVPLGILATKGIEALWGQAIRVNVFFTKPLGCVVFIICVFFLFIPSLKLEASRIKNIFANRMNLPDDKRGITPHGDMDEQYQQIRGETGFLREQNNSTDKIFVCGQPLYYYLSKRSPALAANGWMPEFFLPRQWRQLNEELAAKSPAYVLIDRDCRNIIAEKSPETWQLIENRYRLRIESSTTKAAWYELVTTP